MTVRTKTKYKDLYEVTEAWKANISTPNCNKILIFGNGAFIMYFQNISEIPTIS